MVRGPHAERLTAAITGAQPPVVDDAANEWARCAGILMEVRQYLADTGSKMAWAIGGETGPAVEAAFGRSAEAMDKKSALLDEGAAALISAAQAMRDAIETEKTLDDLSKPPPYRAPVGNPSPSELQQQAQSKEKEGEYNAAMAAQEEKARIELQHLEKKFDHSTTVMKKIHGEPDPVPEPTIPDQPTAPSRSGGSGGGTTGHAVAAPHLTAHAAPVHQAHFDQVDHQTHITYHPTGHPTGGGGDPAPGGDTVGTTSGDQLTGFPTSPISASEIGTTGSSGSGLGVAGATAGGMAAGLLGAKLSGVLKGGLIPTSGAAGAAGRGTAANAVRGIGTSSRTGGAGTLGRSGASAGPGAAGRTGAGGAGAGAAGKSAAAGRSGAGTGARAGTGTGAGGRGGSGGRGGAAGGAAGAGRGGAAGAGRGGRSKDDEKGKKRELFDVDEDWIDDEGAAPGVLD